MNSNHCLAAQITSYGQPICITSVPRPVAGPGQLLIQVEAGGVNPVDWKIRDGLRHQRMPLDMPVVVGCDIAGRVREIGEGVTGFTLGQRVFSMVGLYGGFQQFAAVSADKVAPIPGTLSLADAASIPLAALTAWQALELAHPKEGERILIHAGAGGVGIFAVQLSKILGLEVTATASTSSMAQVEALGADHVVDYRLQAFDEVVRKVNIVLDLVGGDTQRRSWPLLDGNGRLVTTIAVPEKGMEGRGHDVSAARVGVRPRGKDLRHIAEFFDQQLMKTIVQKSFPFERVQDALEFNKAGGAMGKTIIDFPSTESY